MNESAGTPLPMNSTPSHPKLKLSLSFSDRTFIAGEHVCGALEMSSSGGAPGGKEVGIGSMMVEMWGVEELLSRDHTAKAPFLYCRRLFQGPGLPPSNAVHAHPLPNMQPLPAHYYLAKKGQSSFTFRMPLPATSPSSIMFANAARVRYEVRASVQVFWKAEKKVVVQSKEVDVIECHPGIDFGRDEPEAVAVGENGKIWMQGKLIGGVLVAGESACIELQVKNHSTRKNTSLTLALTRTLHLAKAPDTLLISDTLASHPFRGPDFIIPPGAEGVASLVFDVPHNARSVRGGLLEGLDNGKGTHALFEIKAMVTVKMGMGMGRNDIVADIPVIIAHPAVLPALPPQEEEYYAPQEYYDHRATTPYDPRVASPYGAQSPYQQPYYPPMSPPLAYVDPAHHLVWLPPPNVQHPVHAGQPYYYPPPHAQPYIPEAADMPQYHPHPIPNALPSGLPAEIPSGLPAQSQPTGLPPQMHSSVFQPPPPPLTHSAPAQPLRIDMKNLSPVDLSSQGVVHSPRPHLSPKLTPTADPMHNPLGRSERVEELERMADEQDKAGVEVKNAEALPVKDKTLPGPPVPSGKISSVTQSRPRADEYFSIAVPKSPTSEPPAPFTAEVSSSPVAEPSKPIALPIPKGKEPENDFQTPPTPTLNAIAHPLSKKTAPTVNKSVTSLSSTRNSESGLDALERRLLAEVGTRKIRERSDATPKLSVVEFEKSGTKAIDIPSPRSKDSKEEGDSAISSLTLGGEDEKEWDEKTHRGGGPKSRKEDGESHKTKTEGKARKTSDREGKSKRKMASSKGRVAEWLGGVSGGASDVDEGLPLNSEDLADTSLHNIEKPQETKPATSPKPKATVPVDLPKKEAPVQDDIPHPRSSGFMPIGTFKRDAYTRTLIPKDANPWADEPIRLKSVAALGGPEQTNPWKHHKKTPGLPSFPQSSKPAVDNEVKYDVRSARGGRGGKVTSVAAIFAAGAKSDASTPAPATSSPLPKAKPSPGSAAKTARTPFNIGRAPVVSSVAMSSSHATPTLSSTASLARPPTKAAASKGWKPAVTSVNEAPQNDNKSPTPNVAAGYAFGQAKLKDLISKYQHS